MKVTFHSTATRNAIQAALSTGPYSHWELALPELRGPAVYVASIDDVIEARDMDPCQVPHMLRGLLGQEHGVGVLLIPLSQRLPQGWVLPSGWRIAQTMEALLQLLVNLDLLEVFRVMEPEPEEEPEEHTIRDVSLAADSLHQAACYLMAEVSTLEQIPMEDRRKLLERCAEASKTISHLSEDLDAWAKQIAAEAAPAAAAAPTPGAQACA